MLLNGTDVTDRIRRPEVSGCASVVSAHPGVRAHLLEMQRRWRRRTTWYGTAGYRDGGAAGRRGQGVFDSHCPGAGPPPDTGAGAAGTPQSYETTLREIEERDWNDTHRATAPLRQAEDAVMLDTTQLDFQASEEALLRIIQERSGT